MGESGDVNVQNSRLEPFIDVTAEPGKDFTWKYTYTYYTMAKGN